ncbi:CYFA0S12e01629g1_1 [Cyberlindnera fabianii]|uniref:CYFA0S12e01629g1_1 n=1 Tax=Cyberlindnera fabianii TaxID=36022 RepID=A0A061B6M4_CYBFA|nr:Group 1 hemoglobin [Cyberlindnera fabianii]CDR43530.1 CYFA0S12e01629g1_1 [Cyberlindnera fabianii]
MSATGCPFYSHSAEKTDIKAPAVNVTEQQEVSSDEEKPCFYDRLGKYDNISEFAGFLLKRCIESKEIGHFWNTMSEDSFHHELSNFTDFCCVKWGGPAMYKGRDMHTTHRGMGITEEHWQALINIIITGCEEKNLPEDMTQEFLEFVSKYKSAVICGPSFKDCVLNNPDMDVRKKMSAYGVSRHTVFPKQ